MNIAILCFSTVTDKQLPAAAASISLVLAAYT
jgi:hypothetical protein